MKFILKILLFTALLLISKLTKENELATSPAESPQVLVSTKQHSAKEDLPVHKTSGNTQLSTDVPDKPVKNLLAKPAIIE